ncbi:MAG TPA: cbb3-type cytochrome c oxidase subunit 3 [Alphaproteobacteria bacterium]|nr:cbb3-type cytochrome c oxidase subunit 3 [Alphaproteobacteria bacterium]HRI76157.1 cbb3-type cytochrome c oxidase subunit 3 [Alphaproteobacteria bacterium]HRJ66844.1 cbb3-type cytochrome c oxidase subunit 3 [Alphaproteobacteria bacterium]
MMDFFITHAPSVGLVGFFVAFVLIAIATYRPANKKRIESYGNIPFKEQE